MPSQQTEGDHHMGFTATHGLGEFEHRLIGLAGEAEHALAEQLFHAVGDKVSGEEFAAIPGVVNQVCQIFDTRTHPIVLNDRIKAAGLLDRFNHPPNSPLRH